MREIRGPFWLTFSPPEAPSDLTVSAASPSQVRLTWTDNSDDEAGFELERKAGGGSFERITTAGANITTFTDIGRTPNTRYVPVPADYLGTGSAQIGLFRPLTREWLLRTGAGFTICVPFAAPGETPVPADYLGLGRAQIAVYRPGAGEWYLRYDDGRASSGEWLIRADNGAVTRVLWGGLGDVPVPAAFAPRFATVAVTGRP
jgi:hypothetical protein